MKIKRTPVSPVLAEEFLSRTTVSFRGVDYTAPELLQLSKEAALAALGSMQEIVDQSALSKLIILGTLKDIGKRGAGKLTLDPDGNLWCELPTAKAPTPKVTPSEDVKTGRVRLRKGPPADFRALSLDDLRARAKALGVDISSLGRQKKAIFELIEAAENKKPEMSPPPSKRMFRTSQALTPARVIESLPPEQEKTVVPEKEDEPVVQRVFRLDEDVPVVPRTYLPTKSALDLDALIQEGKKTDTLAELAELGGDEIDIDSLFDK